MTTTQRPADRNEVTSQKHEPTDEDVAESDEADFVESTSAWYARVSVRVPRGGAKLATDATRRLERAECVERVTVEQLRSLDPALSATVAEFDVSVVTNRETTRPELETALENAPGVEAVETVRRAMAPDSQRFDPPP